MTPFMESVRKFPGIPTESLRNPKGILRNPLGASINPLLEYLGIPTLHICALGTPAPPHHGIGTEVAIYEITL